MSQGLASSLCEGKLDFSEPLHKHHFTAKPTPRMETMLCATPCCLFSSAGNHPAAKKTLKSYFSHMAL